MSWSSYLKLIIEQLEDITKLGYKITTFYKAVAAPTLLCGTGNGTESQRIEEHLLGTGCKDKVSI
jgi:hypothetical protein